MANLKRHSGVGMVEVLVAAAVFAVGVMALLRLQGSLLESGGDANARSVALSIAQAKLDDLHAFQQVNSGSATTFDFSDIGSNVGSAFANQLAFNYQGVACAAPCASMPAGNIALGNTVYALSWTSADRNVTCTPAATCATMTTAAPPAGTVYPQQKELTITVSWTDRTNTQQTVSINGIVNSIAPAASALVLGGGSLGGAASGSSPKATYTPGAVPDVIPVDLDGGGKRETTTPKPTIVTHGQTVENNLVSFSTVNYDPNNQFQSKEDFVSIDCKCNLRGSAAGKDMTGRTVTKARTGAPADAFQDSLCNTCCNDHHESSDQARISGSISVTGSGNINVAVKSNLDTVSCSNTAVIGGESSYICTYPTTSPGWSGTITASCVGDTQSTTYSSITANQSQNYSLNCASSSATPKINAGLLAGACDTSTTFGKIGCYDPYRTSADYANGDHNHYHKLGAGNNFELASGTTGTGNNQASYYLESCRFKRIDGAFRVVQDWRQIKLNAFDEAELTSNVAGYKSYLSSAALSYVQNGTSPSAWGTKSFSMSANSQPLMARAIYMDYLDYLSAAQKAAISITHIPFYEFNATELADWTPTNDLPNSEAQTPSPDCTNHSVCVTSPSVSNLVRNNVSTKGVVAKINTTPITDSVMVNMKTSNSGVTGTQALDADDWSIPGTAHDTLTLSVPQASVTISGTITATGGSNVAVNGTGSGASAGTNYACAVTSGNTITYSCAVASGWTGSVAISATNCNATTTNYANVTTAQSQNYTLTCNAQIWHVTGSVSYINGANPSVQGVLGANCVAVNGNFNNYDCTVSNNTVINISATATGCTGETFNNAAAPVTSNLTHNFALTCVATRTISGSITATGTHSISGDNGATCTMPSTTTYSCAVASGWSGTLTATANGTGCTSPINQAFNNVTADTTYNFTTPCTYTITGTITASSPHGGTRSAVHVFLDGAGCALSSAGNGANAVYSYTCTITGSGTHTLTATPGAGDMITSPAGASANVTLGTATPITGATFNTHD